MEQQRAVYNQNCRLIVSHPFDVAETYLTIAWTSRTQVGFTNVYSQHPLAHTPHSRARSTEPVPSCTGSGVPPRQPPRLPQRDTRERPDRDRVVGQGLQQISCLLAERVSRDWQVLDRPNGQRADLRRRATGSVLLCSRDFEDRSDLQFILPTLAFQLAHKYLKFRSALVPLLQSDPDVVHESLYNQMEELIVKPLKLANVSTVILIDALDECTDEEPQSAILSVIGRLAEGIPKVKFFITGRPEPRIRSGFRLELLRPLTDVFVLHDVQPSLINNDIKLFLNHELSGLARRRCISGWPTDEHVNLLCRRAAGLFVYAVATVKFLDSKTHLPKQRLDIIINLPECTIPEGKTRFDTKTTLDSLYMSILQMAFSEEDPQVDSKVRLTIGAAILLVNPLTPSGITELTGLDPEEVILFLTLVQSLLTLDEDPNQPVKPFHKSFPDFITNPSRCPDMRFYISPGNLRLEFAKSCLRLMNNGLEQNLLSLSNHTLNVEVDQKAKIKDHISIALEYACRSWHNHLPRTAVGVTSIISDLHIFLEEKFLAWLEVVSVLGTVRGAVVSLETLIRLLQGVRFGLSHYIT